MEMTKRRSPRAYAAETGSAKCIVSSTCRMSNGVVVADGAENVARHTNVRAGSASLCASRQYSSNGTGGECLSPRMCINTSA